MPTVASLGQRKGGGIFNCPFLTPPQSQEAKPAQQEGETGRQTERQNKSHVLLMIK